MQRVKRTTKLSKMMNAYCDRAGKSLNEVRFMYGQSHTTSSFPSLSLSLSSWPGVNTATH